MLSWSTITYGAALSGAGAGILVAAVARPRRIAVIATAVASAFLGPLAWNAILRATGGSAFFHDAAIAAFPVSWQDTGSGVFTLATATVLLGLASMAREPGRRLLIVGLLAAIPALLVDVYVLLACGAGNPGRAFHPGGRRSVVGRDLVVGQYGVLVTPVIAGADVHGGPNELRDGVEQPVMGIGGDRMGGHDVE
jgi:hypothetical protein